MISVGTHDYPDCRDPKNFFTSYCAYGCGARMSAFNSDAPDGIDPFGDCPNAPKPALAQEDEAGKCDCPHWVSSYHCDLGHSPDSCGEPQAQPSDEFGGLCPKCAGGGLGPEGETGCTECKGTGEMPAEPVPHQQCEQCPTVASLIEQRERVQAYHTGAYWMWRDDGDDMPELLTYPVLMPADVCRRMVQDVVAGEVTEAENQLLRGLLERWREVSRDVHAPDHTIWTDTEAALSLEGGNAVVPTDVPPGSRECVRCKHWNGQCTKHQFAEPSCDFERKYSVEEIEARCQRLQEDITSAHELEIEIQADRVRQREELKVVREALRKETERCDELHWHNSGSWKRRAEDAEREVVRLRKEVQDLGRNLHWMVGKVDALSYTLNQQAHRMAPLPDKGTGETGGDDNAPND